METESSEPVSTENKMGTMKMGKLIAQLTIPSIVAQIVNLLYNIVDRIYIGHIPEIGAAALTGAGLFMPILLLINASASLVCAGGAPLLGIALGKKDEEKAEKIMGNCFSLLLVLGIVLTPALFFSASPLLTFFGASEATLPYALPYAQIYILGTILVMITYGMNLFISAQGYAVTSMLSVAIGAAINIGLDPLLMFTFNMGVKGAAIATVISQGVSALWILLFLCSKRSKIRIKGKAMKWEKDILLPCLHLGLSSFIMISTESIVSVCFNHSLSKYGGDLAVGAMTIISALNNLVIMPLQGLVQGGSPILSYNYGAGDSKRVKQAFRDLLIIAVTYALIFWALNMFFPRALVSIFSSDEDLVNYTLNCTRIYFAVIFTFAFQVVCQQSFVALGRARISILLACLRKLVLLIPLIFILPLCMEDKVSAVFLAEPISDFVAAAITTTTFFLFLKKSSKKEEQKA